MAEATIVQIARAVREQLDAACSAAEFRKSFTTDRKYVPVYNLTELETLRITVVGVAESTVRQSRASRRHEYTIEVGVQQRLSRKTETIDEEVDDLVKFV